MNIHVGKWLFVVAAVLGAVAVFAMGFFVALGVRSVVAGPDSAPAAVAPNPGHSWSEIGDLPGTMWHSNNDGAGSGLDGDTVDGLDSAYFAPDGHNHDGIYAFSNQSCGDVVRGINAAGGVMCAGVDNQATGLHAAVGGGQLNTATGFTPTVGGGWQNTASDDGATVGGGWENIASEFEATVGGGVANTASGSRATVGGGLHNTASGSRATVAGGSYNTASGGGATVVGGVENAAAGIYSLAAGRRAKANNRGCFVWGDSYDGDVACSNDDRWVARAGGGVYFYTNSGLTSGSYLASGSGSWSSISDRDLKENFSPVDGEEVLASLAEIPITTWNYKAQEPSIRHVGPVAQDFYSAFGLGESDTAITTVDSDGVALAAIQGLYELVQALEADNATLRQQLDDLQARVTALEGGAPLDDDSAGPLASIMPAGWLVLAGLVVGGLVLVQRRRAGGPR